MGEAARRAPHELNQSGNPRRTSTSRWGDCWTLPAQSSISRVLKRAFRHLPLNYIQVEPSTGMRRKRLWTMCGVSTPSDEKVAKQGHTGNLNGHARSASQKIAGAHPESGRSSGIIAPYCAGEKAFPAVEPTQTCLFAPTWTPRLQPGAAQGRKQQCQPNASR